MPNVSSASAARVPLSTSTPKFTHHPFYRIKITKPFAVPISKQDAKILFGDLGKYEAPDFTKLEVLCRPGAEVEFGTACTVNWGGSNFFIGIVETRRPDRSKTYRVRFLRNGILSERAIECEKESVFPIVVVGGWHSV